jgi:hypothetical protein
MLIENHLHIVDRDAMLIGDGTSALSRIMSRRLVMAAIVPLSFCFTNADAPGEIARRRRGSRRASPNSSVVEPIYRLIDFALQLNSGAV